MLITNRRSWREELLGVWRRRDLLALLARRDLTLRYRQTALGAVWVVLQPLLYSGLFSFVFGSIAHLPTDGVPYFLFAFSGMVAWTLFSNAVSRSSNALLSNTQLVAKIYFPRLILPLATLGVCLVDVLVSSLAMLVLLVSSGRHPLLPLLTLPLWAVALTLLAGALGLIAGALTVRFRDVQYLIPLGLQVLLFGSAVVYAAAAVPHRYQRVIALNPVATFVRGVRWAFLGVERPGLGSLAVALGVTLVLIVVGLDVFRRAEAGFADVI